jgi:hypothetical protein
MPTVLCNTFTSRSQKFPLPLSLFWPMWDVDVTEYTYADSCVRFCHIRHLLCLFKSHIYGEEVKELELEYKTWNSTSV